MHTDSIERNQNNFSYTNFLQNSGIYTNFTTELTQIQTLNSTHVINPSTSAGQVKHE